jgi:hypothetical protein
MALPHRAWRRTGFARTPLHRPVDRVQAWTTLALALLLLLGTPLLAGQAAEHTYRTSLALERAQRAERLAAEAVTLDAAQPQVVAVTGQAVSTARVPVRARWTGVDGAVRVGTVGVPAGTPAGATVRIWLDRTTGQPTVAPRARDETRGAAVLAALLVVAGMAMVLGATLAGLRHRFNRVRMAAWQDEWRRVAPRWTNLV